MAAAAQVQNNKRPKQIKKSSNVVQIRASPDKKFSKRLLNLSANAKTCQSRRGAKFGKKHMAAAQVNEGSAQVNEGSLKLKTYGILCEYVKPVGLKLLKCWFSFVCGADGTGLTNTRKHVQVTKVWKNQCTNYSARSTWQLLHKCKTTNHRSKYKKKIIECCANTCKPWRKVLKMLAKFECERKNLSKSPR